MAGPKVAKTPKIANKTKKLPTERSIRKRIISVLVTFFILNAFVLKYKHAPIAQRIEQARPKGEMMVQFRLGVPSPGRRSSIDRSVYI